MTANMLQVVHPDGKFEQGLEPRLSKEDLLRLYKVMVLTRTVDERAINLQRAGRIGFYVPCAGQEASHLGSAFALKSTDWVFPAYREPGITLLRGWSPKKIINQLMGNAEDVLKGRQMPNHYGDSDIRFVTPSSPIATQIPQAVGCAMAMKIRKDPSVAMTFFGDGATSENDFHSGLNFAGVFQAPVVFICQNNGWAISVPTSKQTHSETMAVKAQAYGFEGVRVDGNDVLAVYAAAKAAVDKAREGGGPTLIECVTYRMGPHSTSDDPTRYRTDTELQEWKAKDPLQRFRLYLLAKGVLTEASDAEIKEAAKQETAQSITEAEKVPPPGPDTLFNDVYAVPPKALLEQKAELLSYLAEAGEVDAGETEHRWS